MKNALSIPPRPPVMTAATAAAPTGQPASRHDIPRMTADNPRSDPTDRSIPPVRMTGVRARARRPISTHSRPTSKAFCRVKKFVLTTPNTAISSNNSNPNPLKARFHCRAGEGEFIEGNLTADKFQSRHVENTGQVETEKITEPLMTRMAADSRKKTERLGTEK